MSGQGPKTQINPKDMKEIMELFHSFALAKSAEACRLRKKRLQGKLEQCAGKRLEGEEYKPILEGMRREARARLNDNAVVVHELSRRSEPLKLCKEQLFVLKIQFEIKKYLEQNPDLVHNQYWKQIFKTTVAVQKLDELADRAIGEIMHRPDVLADMDIGDMHRPKVYELIGQKHRLLSRAIDELDVNLRSEQILGQITDLGITLDEHYRVSGQTFSFS